MVVQLQVRFLKNFLDEVQKPLVLFLCHMTIGSSSQGRKGCRHPLDADRIWGLNTTQGIPASLDAEFGHVTCCS